MLARRARSLASRFWVVPALWSLAAIALGLSVPSADATWLADHLPFLFPGDVDGARSVLGTIAGAMISVTGLVFSNTMVVLQLAGSQFSPRLLQTFLQDRTTQQTLGVFVASFVYSLTVLRSIGDSDAPVPQVAVTISYLWVLAAVAMFIAFISHITASVGVDTVVRRAADDTRALLQRSDRRRDELPTLRPDLADLGHPAVAAATRSGYLDGLDLERLRRQAERHDVRIEVLHPLGTFLVEGMPLTLVHGGGAGDAAAVAWDDVLSGAIDLTDARSTDQDPSFGFRRLVDIAERALSPGINDPTTAVQVIDQLHDLLRRMVVTDDPYPVLLDERGIPRVVSREHTFADYLDLAVDEIAHWGADSIQVPRRIDTMLEDLAAAASPSHRDTVLVKRSQADEASRSS